MRAPWWKLALFVVSVPVLIAAAAWAEREARAKETRRRVARLAEDESWDR